MPYYLHGQPRDIEDVILHLGEDVRLNRRRRIASQAALGARAGVSQSTVSMLENGLAEGIRLETLAKIAASLGLEIVLRPCEHPRGVGRSSENGRTARTRGASVMAGGRRLSPGPGWHPREPW